MLAFASTLCAFSGIKAKESASKGKCCNLIDVNQESVSMSHSSSAVSKSSLSGHTLAAATLAKDDSSDQPMTKESSDSMTVYPSGTHSILLLLLLPLNGQIIIVRLCRNASKYISK